MVRAKHGIPEGSYLLSVCTFEPRKNLRHLVRSFVELLQAHPELSDLFLVLTGGQGWMFEPILAELAGTSLPRGRIITTVTCRTPTWPLFTAGQRLFCICLATRDLDYRRSKRCNVEPR